MDPAGWVEHLGNADDLVIRAGAVVAALGVIGAAVVRVARATRSRWAEAVAEQVDPKIEAVHKEMAAMRSDAQARFDSIESTLGEQNGMGNVVQMLEALLRHHQDEDNGTPGT